MPTPDPVMSSGGKPVVMEKGDATTVIFRSAAPYYLLPKYSSEAEVNKKATEAKFDNWKTLFLFKNTWNLNPELPALTAWKTISPLNTPNFVVERNPYSIWVDTEGNQLPYLDKVSFGLAENLEVVNLRAIAGEYDVQMRHMDLAKLPVLLENQAKGNYKVHLDPAQHGPDAGFRFNMTFKDAPEIAKWITNTDFRRALGLGIDRAQLNETFWLGLGTPGSAAPGENTTLFPGAEWRTKWHTYDPKTANEMLDKLGLDKKDGEGYRVRTDGKGRLRVEVMSQGGTFMPWTQISEVVKEQWKKIGVQVDVVEVQRSLNDRRIQAGEHQIDIRSNDGNEDIFAERPANMFAFDARSVFGPDHGRWFATDGAAGKEPPPRVKELMAKYKQAFSAPGQQAIELGKECWRIAVDEVLTIGTVGVSPAVAGCRVTKNHMANVPDQVYNSSSALSPGPSMPEQWFIKS